MPLSVKASLLALRIAPDIYKSTKELDAPQLSLFHTVSYHLFSINTTLQNVWLQWKAITLTNIVKAEAVSRESQSRGTQFMCELWKLATKFNFGTYLNQSLPDQSVASLHLKRRLRDY